MKRSTHSDHETPKRRRKGRGPHTASPQPRNGTDKSVNLTGAKTSAELFQKAIQNRKRQSDSEPPLADARSALGPPMQVVVGKQQPSAGAAPPSENIESTVKESNSADDIELQKRLMKERTELARKRQGEEAAREEAERMERLQKKIDVMLPVPVTNKGEKKDDDAAESSWVIVAGQESAAAVPPSENLESPVEKLPQSDLLDDLDSQKKAMKERIEFARKRRQEESARYAADRKELFRRKGDSLPLVHGGKKVEKKVVEKKDGAGPSTVDLTSAVLPGTETVPRIEIQTKEVSMEALEIVQVQQPGSGATAEDAMDVDAYPSEQREQDSHTNSQQPAEGQVAQGGHHVDKSASLVSTQWLLDKLHGLSAANLDGDRAAMIQDLKSMEDEVARLPRAEMHAASSHVAANNPTRRLLLIENLIGPDTLAKIPKRTWAGYKQRLLRMCANPNLSNMDYRQRLEKIKDIVFLPEEMELLRHGNGERIGCAIRLCAAVTEITGRDDEIVPEEMAAWVDVQIKDVAWKAKVTSVWRKYWPGQENATVVD